LSINQQKTRNWERGNQNQNGNREREKLKSKRETITHTRGLMTRLEICGGEDPEEPCWSYCPNSDRESEVKSDPSIS
jgi:hypothetical protein